MLKSLFLPNLHNRWTVGKIVGNKLHDVTVGELMKCGKFETVFSWFQVHIEFQRKTKVFCVTTQNPKLAFSSSPRMQNLKENGLDLDGKRMLYALVTFARLCRTLYRRQLRTKSHDKEFDMHSKETRYRRFVTSLWNIASPQLDR